MLGFLEESPELYRAYADQPGLAESVHNYIWQKTYVETNLTHGADAPDPADGTEQTSPNNELKRRLRTYQTFQALFPNAVVAFQERSQYRFYGQCALDVRNVVERSVYYQHQPDGEELAFTSYPVEQEEEMLRRLNQAGLYTVVAVQDAAGGPHRVKQVLNGPDPSPIRDNPPPPETQTEVPIPFPITSAEWDRILPDFKRETDGRRSILYQNALRPVVIDDEHGHALRRFHYEDKGVSRWVLAYTEDEALRVLEGYSLENTALTSEPLEGEGSPQACPPASWTCSGCPR